MLNGDILEYENIGSLDGLVDVLRLTGGAVIRGLNKPEYRPNLIQYGKRVYDLYSTRHRTGNSRKRLRPSIKYGVPILAGTAAARWKYVKHGHVTERGEGPPAPTSQPILSDMNGNDKMSIGGLVRKYEGSRPFKRKGKPFGQGNLHFTWYRYNMNPLQFIQTLGYDQTTTGIGPSLYWLTDEGLTSAGGTLPNPTLGMLRPYAPPTETSSGLWGNVGIIYLFSCDWFGGIMNPDPNTQGLTYANQILAWQPFAYSATTDPNTPIVIADILGPAATANRDWRSITHLATHITFDFTNLAPFPYIVEILIFKFKVDPNDMTYEEMVLAPMVNQDDMQSYCEQNDKNFGTHQIRVIKRKRIKIYGLDNPVALTTTATTTFNFNIANAVHQNKASYKFKCKRKYVINRPVHQGTAQDTNSEVTLYNKYYDDNEGIYCRVQAWPASPLYQIVGANASGSYVSNPQINNFYDIAAQPTFANNLTQLRPSVSCIMEKKSFLKFDQPILKGPFRSS